MATFEKGKGTRRHSWDTRLHGAVISAQEWWPSDQRLRAYRRMSSQVAAEAEQRRLVAEKIREGFLPADEAAKAIVALIPPEAPGRGGPPRFPVRQDVYVCNEGTGFLITSGKMAGKGIENEPGALEKAVRAGNLIPVSLFQDDSFVVRVVAGDDLNEQEDEEWVGRIDARLKVQDGRLVVSAVADFVAAGYEEGDLHDYVRFIDIPKGTYDVTVYSYLPGINGAPCLDQLAGGYRKMERAGAWFRRTRPDTEFPAWLRRWCIGDAGDDPGHEREWAGLPYPSDDSMPEYVDFLVHLRPSQATAKSRKAKGPAGGWFDETAGARKPDRCPLGLVGVDVTGHAKVESGTWIYARDFAERVESFALLPLEPALRVQASDLQRIFGLAWLAHPHSLAIVRIQAPDASGFIWDGDPPDGLVIVQDGVIIRILPGSEATGAVCRAGLASLGERLKALPDGSIVEMSCASSTEPNPKAGDGGLQRYRGTIQSGVWRIDEVYPPVPTDRVKQGLALIDELDSSRSLAVRDEAEAKAILKWLRGNFGPFPFEGNHPRFESGVISLQKPDAGLLWLVGTAAFAIRLKDVFPVRDLSDDEDADGEEPVWKKREVFANPLQIARVFEAASGRIYFQSVAFAIARSLTERVQSRERELFALGFSEVGDLVCSAFPRIVVRAYARPDGDTWATYLVAAPDRVLFELTSRLGDGTASLLTTEGTAADDPAKKSFRQSLPGRSTAEMVAAHERRMAELREHFGPPIELTPTLQGLAESVEANLSQREGGSQ